MKPLLKSALGVATALTLSMQNYALADSADGVLNITWSSELSTLNRYLSADPEANIVQHLVFDNLIYRDPATFEYKPALAESWEFLDETTLQFKLREGVSFHNGEAFTSDDVAATIEYLTDPASNIATQRNIAWISGVEVVDDFTVNILLNYPFPAAIEFLAGPLPMMAGDVLRNEGAAVFDTAPVGTGPYVVESVTPGREITFARFDGHYDASPKAVGNVERIVQRTIPDANTQSAELISGSIDWMWRVPEDLAEQMNRVPSLSVSENESMRVGFMILDSAGRSGDTPLANRLVRQAVAHAIDRETMAQQLVGEKSRVLSSFCFPLQVGCSDDGISVPSYDPDAARALLAEAGFSDGFSTTIYAFSNRSHAEAIINYLNAVDIRAELRFLKFPALFEAFQNGEVPLASMNWGSFGVSDVSALTSQFFIEGKTDYAQNAQLSGLLSKADVTIDAAERDDLYRQALTIIGEELYAIPMFSHVTLQAYSSDLTVPAQTDEFPHLYQVTWN